MESGRPSIGQGLLNNSNMPQPVSGVSKAWGSRPGRLGGPRYLGPALPQFGRQLIEKRKGAAFTRRADAGCRRRSHEFA